MPSFGIPGWFCNVRPGRKLQEGIKTASAATVKAVVNATTNGENKPTYGISPSKTAGVVVERVEEPGVFSCQ
jgi:hypothetical protein